MPPSFKASFVSAYIGCDVAQRNDLMRHNVSNATGLDGRAGGTYLELRMPRQAR